MFQPVLHLKAPSLKRGRHYSVPSSYVEIPSASFPVHFSIFAIFLFAQRFTTQLLYPLHLASVSMKTLKLHSSVSTLKELLLKDIQTEYWSFLPRPFSCSKIPEKHSLGRLLQTTGHSDRNLCMYNHSSRKTIYSPVKFLPTNTPLPALYRNLSGRKQ